MGFPDSNESFVTRLPGPYLNRAARLHTQYQAGTTTQQQQDAADNEAAFCQTWDSNRPKDAGFSNRMIHD